MKLNIFETLKIDKKDNIFKAKLIKFILLFLVIGLFAVGIKVLIDNLYSWSYFNITCIKIEDSPLSTDEAAQYCDIDLLSNILKLDLDEVASDIKKLHPEVKEVVVRRELPNTLIVTLKRRKPVAEVEVSGKFYKIDKEAFVLPDYIETPHPELPDIVGIRSSQILKNLLRTCDSKRLQHALKLLNILKETQILESYRISKIDVSNYHNITFSIDDKIEIKLGRDNFRQKLNVLRKSLPSVKLDEIKYIDLRFEDVIIGTE